MLHGQWDKNELARTSWEYPASQPHCTAKLYPAWQGADAEELLLLALRGSEALEPLRQWLKLLLQSSPKLTSLQAMAADQGETVGQQPPSALSISLLVLA